MQSGRVSGFDRGIFYFAATPTGGFKRDEIGLLRMFFCSFSLQKRASKFIVSSNAIFRFVSDEQIYGQSRTGFQKNVIYGCVSGFLLHYFTFPYRISITILIIPYERESNEYPNTQRRQDRVP